WTRFKNTKKELGNLVESAAEGEHKVIFDELLRELPKAMEADPKLRQVFDSKLAPLHLYNQQLKQLRSVGKRLEQEMPKTPEEQRRRLLVFRDSSHLLATFRNTDAGEELLRFKPAKWCFEELPELADMFLCHYQIAQSENRAAPLEKAHEIVVRALAIGKLEPIEVIIGKTDFNNKIHIGRSSEQKPQYPTGTIVGVVKNGFRHLRDGRMVVQPEVIVNRI
ncbi:MAG: hypothetical protein GY725_09255, partial [bacterium]|nr:hypothetical protein [bacterium]